MLAHNEEGAFWQRTQELLQSPDDPLVRKPKLTENLLRKPPFRFLHDVISEVQRNTGFASGLYTEYELNSANVKDKESKVSYLNKIIDTIAEVNQMPKAAKALKVVAGLEPENTNKFLQQLAEAALRNDGSEAVAKVLGIELPSAGKADGHDHDEKSSNSISREEENADQFVPHSKFGSDTDTNEEGNMTSTQMMNDESFDERSNNVDSTNALSTSERMVSTNTLQFEEEAPSNMQGFESMSVHQDQQQAPIAQGDMQQHQQQQALAIDSSNEPPFAGQQQRTDMMNNMNTLDQQQLQQQQQSSLERGIVPIPAPRFIRPSSARKGPPRLKQTNEASKSELNTARRGSISSGDSLSVAGVSTSTKKNNILIDDGDDDDDDDVVVVMPSEENQFQSADSSHSKDDDNVAGKLVSNMLAEKDQLEQQASSLNETSREDNVDDDKPKGIVLRRRLSVSKVGDSSFGDKPQKKADINALRESIQNLCQYTAPLTKTLDYIQEDVDNMNKELQHWNNETKLNNKLYGRQDDNLQSIGDQTQFNTTVAELDMDIIRQKEKIHSTKSQILRNEQRIQHLLQLVVNGSSGY